MFVGVLADRGEQFTPFSTIASKRESGIYPSNVKLPGALEDTQDAAEIPSLSPASHFSEFC
jgi:hypothetical protein